MSIDAGNEVFYNLKQMDEPIFSISGLRGVVNRGLSAELVMGFAAGYARFLGGGRFALGRDTRPSGKELVAAAMMGLGAAGAQVIDLGVCPTPSVVNFVRHHQGEVRGGLVLTASHNPLEWNGIKFVGPAGRFLLPAEFEEFRRALADLNPVKPRGTPAVVQMDAVAEHIQAIRESGMFADVDGAGLRIGVDAVNGAAAVAGVELLRSFGCEVVPVFCSPADPGAGFPRGPEPTAENLNVLSEMVRRENLDCGFAFDPDGDRFSCVDETGMPLGEEASLCLASLFVLPQRPGPVVVNFSTSRAVEDIGARFGVPVLRTRVGEVWVVKRMLEEGAVLGGEGNGGVILPEVNLTRDGLLAAAVVVGLLKKTGRRLSAIRQELPVYYQKKVAVPADGLDWTKVANRLVARFGSGVVLDRSEGLRCAGDDWWVHIRQSNTEPIVRVVAEAKSERLLADVIRCTVDALAEDRR